MYAVIETGGKQYRVEVGTELEIDLVDAGPGETLAFERILLVADGDTASVGRPVVENASVAAEVLRRDRGEKVISFKYRPKARRRVKKGHRSDLTVIRISDIVLDGKSAAAEAEKAQERKKSERQRLEEAARKQAEQDAALAAKLAADRAKTEKTEKADKAEKGADKTSASSKSDTKPSGRAKTTTKTDTTEKKAGTAKSTAAPKTSRARKTEKD